MRGGRPWVVLAVTLLAVVGLAVLPVAAQTDGEPTTTTAPPETTTTSPGITIFPTTTTTELFETTTTAFFEATTTTSAPRTTTTASTLPPVTVPATTTTTELPEAPGPVEMPTTTTSPASTGDTDEGLSAGTIVALVITGLLLVAAGLGYFTWRFWRSTDPRARASTDDTVAPHG